MGEIIRNGEYSGNPYRFTISGDTPNADEMQRIDAILQREERAFAERWQQNYGENLLGDEGSGLANYLGEIPKGIIGGAANVAEQGALGLAALLPESWENPARESIRRAGYGFQQRVAPDVGLEDTYTRKISEGIGSFGAFALPAIATGGTSLAGYATSAGLGGFANMGAVSEDARASGATLEERNAALAQAFGIGMTEALPVSGAFFLGGLARSAAGAGLLRNTVGSLSRIAAEGGVEAAQEAAVEIANNWVAQGIYDPERDLYRGAGESAVIGGSVGAIVQGLVELATAGARRRGGTTPERIDQGANTTDTDVAATATQATSVTQQPAAPQVENGTIQSADGDAQLTSTDEVAQEEATQEETADPTAGLEYDTIEDMDAFAREVNARVLDPNTPEKTTAEAIEAIASERGILVDVPAVEAEVDRLLDTPSGQQEMFEQEELGAKVKVGTKETSETLKTGEQSEDAQDAQLEMALDDAQEAKETAEKVVEEGQDAPKTATRTPEPEPARAGVQADLSGVDESGARSESGEVSDGGPAEPETLDGRRLGGAEFQLEGLDDAEIGKPATLAPPIGPRVSEERELARRRAAAESAILRAVHGSKANEGISQFLSEFDDVQDVSTVEDMETVADLVKPRGKAFGPKAVGEENAKLAKSARQFFGTNRNPTDAVQDIAWHIANGRQEGPRSTKGESAYFQKKNREKAKEAAEWVRLNLSDAMEAELDVAIKDEIAAASRIAKRGFGTDAVGTRKAIDEQVEGWNKQDAETVFAVRGLVSDAVSDVFQPAHPIIRRAIRSNDLGRALDAIALTIDNPSVTRVARMLKDNVGTTRMRVSETPLTDADGNRLAGLFDPQNNEIVLDPEFGINTHSVLHEAAHAATLVAIRDPKNRLLTNRLKEAFQSAVKDAPAARGAENIDEFVTEFFVNPEYRQQLAQSHENANPQSALTRILNEIINWFRKKMGIAPAIKEQNPYADVDAAIEAILAPSPDTYDAGSVYMRTLPGAVGNMLGNVVRGVGAGYRQGVINAGLTSEASMDRIQNIKDDRGAVWLRMGLYGFMAQQSMVDMAKKIGMGAQAMALMVATQNKQGAITEDVKRADTFATDIAKEIDALPEAQQKLLRDVIAFTTTRQVDPELGVTDARRKYGATTERMDDWADAKDQWRQMSEPAKGAYRRLRTAYREQYVRLINAMNRRIDELSKGDPAVAAQIKKTFAEKYANLDQIEPYFALARDGDYWAGTDLFNEKTQEYERVVRAFGTAAARDQWIAEINALPDAMKRPATDANNQPIMRADGTREVMGVEPWHKNEMTKKDFLNRVPSSMMEEIVSKAESLARAAQLPESEVDEFKVEIANMMLASLPESSVMRNLMRRKGVAGFIADPVEAFKQRGVTMARSVAEFEHNHLIRKAQRKLNSDFEKSRQNAAGIKERPLTADEEAIMDSLNATADFATTPPPDTLWTALNRFGFLYTLGFNVSSMIVNLSALAVVATPYLGSKFGNRQAVKAMRHASALFARSGRTHFVSTPGERMGQEKLVTTKAMQSIDNYYIMEGGKYRVRDDMGLSQEQVSELNELIPLVESAGARAFLSRSALYDTLDVSQSSLDQGFTDRLSAVGGWIFHHGERFNRQTMMVAAYQLHVAKMKEANGGHPLTQEQLQEAAGEALYDTQHMNGSAILGSAPRWTRQGFGRTAFMFKGYGMQMAYMQFAAMKDLVQNMHPGNDPEARAKRNQAMKMLATQYGLLTLLAGVTGLPLYGAVAAVADLFLDDDEEDFEFLTRQALGEFWYKGGITAATGADVSDRIGLDLVDWFFRSNRFNPDASPEETLFYHFGGPAWSSASSIMRGVKELASDEGSAVRGVEAMLPAAFRNFIRAGRYSVEGGAFTRRGDPIFDDMSTGALAAQALGFAPAGYTAAQDVNYQLKRIESAVMDQRASLYRRYFQAYRNYDMEEMLAIQQEMVEFNARHPEAAIDSAGVRKSVQSNLRTSQRMYNGVSLNPAYEQTLRQQASDFEDNLNTYAR